MLDAARGIGKHKLDVESGRRIRTRSSFKSGQNKEISNLMNLMIITDLFLFVVEFLCGNKILRQRIAISQVTTCSLSENGHSTNFVLSSSPS